MRVITMDQGPHFLSLSFEPASRRRAIQRAAMRTSTRRGREGRRLLARGILMPRQTALPPLLTPRLISREAAAAYICVSPNTFDEMVRDGRMPRPRLLGERRRAWDVRALDLAIDRLPLDGDDPGVDETWRDVDASETPAIR
jgi:predicted DNA-binding transcriptional regulator AlpA